MLFVRRLALDTIPAPRMRVLAALDGTMSLEAIQAKTAPMSRTATRRQLEDLEAVGLVRRQVNGGRGDLWSLSQRALGLLAQAFGDDGKRGFGNVVGLPPESREDDDRRS
jgi:hypothetical protein